MSSNQLKNTLLLDVLNGEETSRPPVWMMRQAGRYLPEYMAIKEKYSFFERVKTPELACEITIQPVDIVGVDAAIIFSDILVLLECLNIEVQLKPNFGPYLPNPIRSAEQVNDLQIIPAEEQLSYVYDALSLTRKTLDGRVPLIGFAGAPWTLFCYLVEGQGSKTFSTAKSFLFAQPQAAHKLMQVMTEQTIQYLHHQVKAGAQALQVFDSWAAALGPDDYSEHILPYVKMIADEDYDAPLILFCKDAERSYKNFSKSNVNAFGIGWGCKPETAREFAGGKVVQGNFDPSKLLSTPEQIQEGVREMIDRFGTQNYIANLGHGILPNVPVENAKAFVDAVKDYQP